MKFKNYLLFFTNDDFPPLFSELKSWTKLKELKAMYIEEKIKSEQINY